MHKPLLLRYANTVVAAVALVAATGYVSTQRAAFAADPPFTCDNMIDETMPCPGPVIYTYSYSPDGALSCRASAAFYDAWDVFHTNPKYGCCDYAMQFFRCRYTGPNGTMGDGDMGRKHWFRSQSPGAGSCINGKCISQ